KAGSPKDAPKPVAFVEGWNIKPDAVVEMPVEFNAPASGTIDYQYIILPTGFTEDKWIQMAEVRPGNRAILHHVIAFVREPGNNWLKNAPTGKIFVPKDLPKEENGNKREQRGMGEFVVGYAPGAPPEIIRPGRAKLVKAGSDVVFQLHYTANGKP